MIFSLFLFDAVKNFISLFRCKTKIATRHEFGRPCSLPPTRKTKQNTSVKWVSQRPNWLRYRGRARCCVSPTTTTIAVTRNRWRERRLPRTYAAGDLYGDGRLGLSSAKFSRERERDPMGLGIPPELHRGPFAAVRPDLDGPSRPIGFARRP